ncbi:MAG: hypothetical protein JWL59_200 [Chthoniobacteraceae bacterium]|nr:hypothetical protein [Chthoniobacteraceae bacterium]
MKIGLKFFLAPAAALLFFRLASFGAPVPIELPGIENAFRVTDRIFSGSQPESDAAFAELARLGIKTVLSVDGSKPDVERARRFGLRYVHLPFGYDGVPTGRAAQLAQAAATLPAPLFVHCHHGKHRGPAAVAILCEAAGGWTPAQAEEWLKQAGTAPEYPGLYDAVRGFKPVSLEQIARLGALPELSQSAPLVDLMVEIDLRFDLLKEARKTGWIISPGGRLPEASTLLWEHFRELARNEETAGRPEDYRNKVAQAERASQALREALYSTPPELSMVETAFNQMGQSCVSCHKTFRNKGK